jgi:hypothetical protein
MQADPNIHINNNNNKKSGDSFAIYNLHRKLINPFLMWVVRQIP